MRFAENPENAPFNMLNDELADAILRHVPDLGNAWNLEQRPLRRNIGIKPAA